MQTKLNHYCNSLMEAAWLAAVIIAPVFFNVYSSRIFEPDKITLLRTLALLILAAWVVRLLEQGGFHWKNWQKDDNGLKTLLKIPLIMPVLFLAGVYIIATVFSVSPGVSIWGSYQRLQGVYTTFSYLVIFAAMAVNLRGRVQVERLFTTIIIASLPVALYGVLQRYKLDPIPWGGDVTRRVASSLGNSIFIAAYLIMVFPLTLGRIVESFRAILNEHSHLGVHVLRASLYLFIGVLQVIALYLSGSRGPALGLFAGFFFFVFMLTVWQRLRWVTITMVGVALVLAAFLLVFNLEKGPLEALRTSPAIGRFGLLLNAESNSAQVRRYIWEGVVKLVTPHPPLEYPDGSSDRFNLIRPLVGYGPESMFVAYNPFYIPALGVVEKRNAAPDRSHNETWDSIVMTGVLGLIAYFWLFTSVFYYGLKWMGLVATRLKQRLFFGLYIGGGVAGGLFFSIWRGIEYLGVGIPFGILIGLIVYIVLAALWGTGQEKDQPVLARSESETARFMALVVLLAAILSHFVEINFGIAIGVTRVYFWVYAALLLLVGEILPRLGEYATSHPILQPVDIGNDAPLANQVGKRASSPLPARQGSDAAKRTRRNETGLKKGTPGAEPRKGSIWSNEALYSAGLISIVLVTLGFDLISNQQKSQTALAVFWNSLTSLQAGTTSYAILALLATTWLVSSILFSAEATRPGWGSDPGSQFRPERSWRLIFPLVLGVSLVLSSVYWLWHSAGLAVIARTTPASLAELMTQVNRYSGVLSRYYLYLLILAFFIAFFLVGRWSAQESYATRKGIIAAPAALIIFGLLAFLTNLRIIQADITFKLAAGFNQPGSWPVAIQIYDQANQMAPNEDYYYLLLGRAYLEQARSLTNPAEQSKLLNQAAQDLLRAQTINPLNTDHTANLARLYSLWALYIQDPLERQEKALQSDQYFSRATVLSPNNVRLWNEWAYLALQILQQPQQAQQRLERALQIDPSYDWTYGQLGNIYVNQAEQSQDAAEKTKLLEKAVDYYTQSLGIPGETQFKYSFGLALGGVQTQLGHFREAIAAYSQALQVTPHSSTAWQVEETLARLYVQTGDLQQGLQHANNALASAPEGEQERLKAFMAQINNPPK
jgi:tetratricopeptide (TPR) repeat protein